MASSLQLGTWGASVAETGAAMCCRSGRFSRNARLGLRMTARLPSSVCSRLEEHVTGYNLHYLHLHMFVFWQVATAGPMKLHNASYPVHAALHAVFRALLCQGDGCITLTCAHQATYYAAAVTARAEQSQALQKVKVRAEQLQARFHVSLTCKRSWAYQPFHKSTSQPLVQTS